MIRHTSSKTHGREGGFTLVELLVVIVILGILSAVVVFAVRGLGAKGKAEAVAVDRRIVQTAEEAYCAQNGHYAEMGDANRPGTLVGDRYLSEPSQYSTVRTTVPGPCGNTGYVIDTAQLPPPPGPCAPEKWCTHDTPPGFGPGLLLSNGKVFLMGITPDGNWAIALYDPALPDGQRWQAQDPLPGTGYPLMSFIELDNGKILVHLYSERPLSPDNSLGYIWWLFDRTQPRGGQWQGISHLDTDGTHPTAQRGVVGLAKLSDGRVLAIKDKAGGAREKGGAELYNPADGQFLKVADDLGMGSPLLVTLTDGTVLVVSGIPGTTTGVAKLFDPDTKLFTAAAAPANAYGDPLADSAVRLPGGKVLFVGPRSTEIYDPGPGQWSSATTCQTPATVPLTAPENCHMLGLLSNGKVLAYTATDPNQSADKKTWLFDPNNPNASWVATGELNSPASAGFGVVLPSGKVMTIGSGGSSELYTPRP